MPLEETLRGFYISCQQEMFPKVEQQYGELSKWSQLLLHVFEMVRVHEFLPVPKSRKRGRPLTSRASLARSFLAKMVLNIPTTSGLRDRLISDPVLRSLCGWPAQRTVPSASTFSRAFQEFAESELPTRIHAKLIEQRYQEHLVGHISRDSTAIEAREKPVPKTQAPKPKKRKRGRPKKGGKRPKEPRRLEYQPTMSLEQMVNDLPKDCTVGCKKNAKGYTQKWIGFKFHMDAADGGVPISCAISSASLHDSQAAIALATMTQQRGINCYDLMDSAYDAKEIHAHCEQLKHVAIIDPNPRNRKAEYTREQQAQRHAGFTSPQRVRYTERSTVERAFGRLKDEVGARHVRVRGYQKVMCHLMFGVVVLAVDQLLRMIQ
ncbi:MAG: transposase [Rhodothermaceae bacterium]|nr:transposase [Rhodothermaceae bacterium]MYG69876.1 transposase [Rhodothermaceae bacterium]MYJ44483.1 transposase [Rhodothermaceae bacterium]